MQIFWFLLLLSAHCARCAVAHRHSRSLKDGGNEDNGDEDDGNEDDGDEDSPLPLLCYYTSSGKCS
jgi:hypothetical protein